MNRFSALSFLPALLLCSQLLHASDWPQWRYDSGRSAASPEDLPQGLHLLWTRQYSQRLQVWDDPLNHDLMSFDKVFEPVVLENRMFIGFNDRDKVVALDTRTGQELWTFFTEGPVRLPCAAWKGKVYFASDDGHLYCVNAADGALLWKHRGGPSERKVLGNGRLISAWPARGGPVIRDGKVYYAASIWPFMGTFIHALDAATGETVWVNDGTGSQYIKQPHGAPAFAGVAPQGALVATRDTLLVPGGRSVPAGFDLQTGRFRFFQLEDGGKGNGGSFVAAFETNFFVHTRLRGTRMFDLSEGRKRSFTINEPVLTPEAFYSGQPNSFLQTAVLDAEQGLASARQGAADAQDNVMKAKEDESSASIYKRATNSLASAVKKVRAAEKTLATAQKALSNSWTGCVIQAVGRDKRVRWQLKADGTGDIIKAGRHLYAAGTNSIVAIEVPRTGKPLLAWSNHVDGQVLRLLAADDKLFAVTLDGRIMAFGSDAKAAADRLVEQRTRLAEPQANISATVARILGQAGKQGYALCYGVDDGRLIEAVLAQSELHIVAVDPDPARVVQLRRRLDAAGVYGSRIALHTGEPLGFKAPPYVATLVIVGDSVAPRLAGEQVLKTVYESVRPYDGVLWVSRQGMDSASLIRQVRSSQLGQARTQATAEGTIIYREGALPGSADWTHQYGNAANTVKSDDRLVKLPLGVLWFGGNTHMDVLPRHGHGPSEQVAGGRLFIEGMSCISARDVYTGRVLWRRDFSDLGTFGVFYDKSYTNAPLSTAYNQKHIPGANARGANYVATADAVYVVEKSVCHVLDTRSGRTLRTIALPRRAGEAAAPEWGYIAVEGDVLLAGAGFAHYTTRLGLSNAANPLPGILDFSASRGLVAIDRHTGRVLWRTEARHSFLHNGIVAGNRRVYCLDKLPRTAEDKLKRRGRAAPSNYRIAAFDLRTGRVLWEANTNVFGTWLGYSARHDVLLQAGAAAVDRLKDEASRGMLTYRGSDGAVIWKAPDLKYTGPPVLHNDTILTTPTAYKSSVGGYGLLDGKPRTVRNPLTGQPEPLRVFRTYGCNYPIACEHLMTFRSGAAGYYDLETHSGTGNFGGFKSGCSANLIAAGGVLNAPDYTRTCTCAYQNQTSLALVHMPELERWTHNQYGADAMEGERIKRVGINFGAPGDRLSDTGTLWLDYPSVGGSSPNLFVSVRGSRTNYFRRHSSQVAGEGPAWVMASGLSGVEHVVIQPETLYAIPPYKPKKSAEDSEPDEDAASHNGLPEDLDDSGMDEPANTTGTAAPPAVFTVRLYFAEPESLAPGERVFNVQLQDRLVLREFDVAAAAGGAMRGVIREFRNVRVAKNLVIDLTPARGKGHGPILSGVELIMDEAFAGETLPGGQ